MWWGRREGLKGGNGGFEGLYSSHGQRAKTRHQPNRKDGPEKNTAKRGLRGVKSQWMQSTVRPSGTMVKAEERWNECIRRNQGTESWNVSCSRTETLKSCSYFRAKVKDEKRELGYGSHMATEYLNCSQSKLRCAVTVKYTPDAEDLVLYKGSKISIWLIIFYRFQVEMRIF